jgi:hypothetical protein
MSTAQPRLSRRQLFGKPCPPARRRRSPREAGVSYPRRARGPSLGGLAEPVSSADAPRRPHTRVLHSIGIVLFTAFLTPMATNPKKAPQITLTTMPPIRPAESSNGIDAVSSGLHVKNVCKKTAIATPRTAYVAPATARTLTGSLTFPITATPIQISAIKAVAIIGPSGLKLSKNPAVLRIGRVN